MEILTPKLPECKTGLLTTGKWHALDRNNPSKIREFADSRSGVAGQNVKLEVTIKPGHGLSPDACILTRRSVWNVVVSEYRCVSSK
jgi:hypothetical protein